VDKEFVSDISTNEYSRSITAMVINLAHELKVQNICEGIETEEQLAIVRDLGCDIIQGYIVGKSQPEDVAREMISTFRLPANSSSKTK
jgi:EAL domain-containing protein (putative c-di-GMP-specific phosphodiesterase class I)